MFVKREMLNRSAKTTDEPRTGKPGRSLPMNHSIYSADRMTHLKVVVVALVAGIVVLGFGISARSTDEGYTQTARVMKAGKPVMVTNSNNSLVR
jgi:hypothetical protein